MVADKLLSSKKLTSLQLIVWRMSMLGIILTLAMFISRMKNKLKYITEFITKEEKKTKKLSKTVQKFTAQIIPMVQFDTTTTQSPTSKWLIITLPLETHNWLSRIRGAREKGGARKWDSSAKRINRCTLHYSCATPSGSSLQFCSEPDFTSYIAY